MWQKDEKLGETETVIGPSVHLEGNFNSQGNIQIAGSLSGSLQTAGIVKVEAGAMVHANIVAKEVIIDGEVKGDVKAAERLELGPTARLWGNIETKVLSVAPGAFLSGKCNMKGGKIFESKDKEKEKEKEVVAVKENKENKFLK